MKKNFPVIFILITFSLVGIIYIQINWVFTMVENKQEELNQELIHAMHEVGQELMEKKGLTPISKPFIWGREYPAAFGRIHAGIDETAHGGRKIYRG